MSSRAMYRPTKVSRDDVGMDDSDDDFDEEKVGELYHFKIKNVPINFQKATSVPFMDDIMDIPFENNFTITLDNSKADNTEVPAKHHFKFPMKYTPPLPRGPVMIYLQRENGLKFSSQTQLRPDRDMFRLETTNSNEVLALYSVISGEKTSTRSFDISPEPSKSSKTGIDLTRKTENRKILCTKSKIATIVIKNKKKEEVEIHLAVTIQGVIDIKCEEFKKGLSHLTFPVIFRNVIESGGMTNELNPENVITCDMKVPANET